MEGDKDGACSIFKDVKGAMCTYDVDIQKATKAAWESIDNGSCIAPGFLKNIAPLMVKTADLALAQLRSDESQQTVKECSLTPTIFQLEDSKTLLERKTENFEYLFYLFVPVILLVLS
jgi:hypothetical protein